MYARTQRYGKDTLTRFFLLFSSSGLMADQMGSYGPAFYTFGSLVVFAAFLPFILLCLKAPDDNTGQGDLEIRIESSSDHQTTTMDEHLTARTATKKNFTQSGAPEQNNTSLRDSAVEEYWFVTSL